jgi:hypothetical protein
MLLVKSGAGAFHFLKAFFSGVFLGLVAGAEAPAYGLGVEI